MTWLISFEPLDQLEDQNNAKSHIGVSASLPVLGDKDIT